MQFPEASSYYPPLRIKKLRIGSACRYPLIYTALPCCAAHDVIISGPENFIHFFFAEVPSGGLNRITTHALAFLNRKVRGVLLAQVIK